jgi:hypothetical protein
MPLKSGFSVGVLVPRPDFESGARQVRSDRDREPDAPIAFDEGKSARH